METNNLLAQLKERQKNNPIYQKFLKSLEDKKMIKVKPKPTIDDNGKIIVTEVTE